MNGELGEQLVADRLQRPGVRANELVSAPFHAAPSDISGLAPVSLYEIAQLIGEELPAVDPFTHRSFPVRRFNRRDYVQRAGERFATIFVVQAGVLMTSVCDGEGAEQVLAFPMRGDVFGLDGIGQTRVIADVIALDNSRVIAVSFAQLADLSREHSALQRLVHRLFGREISGKREMLRVLGSFNAEARVASFLIDLSHRYARLGVASEAFALPMRRQDMARYLGLQLETVSRAMSSLDQLGALAVEGKRVSIRDWNSLRRIADCGTRHVRRVA